MIVSKTPFRMSFFGGGTDIPEFFDEYGGSVISTSIDKYCYCILRRLPGFFDYKSELVYSKIERVRDISEIEHPAIRAALRLLETEDIRLSYEADLPARSGLGTSSSFAVGMLHAIHTLKNEPVSKRELADEAILLERDLLSEAGGWQDQIAASYGGLNRIDFRSGGYEVRPIEMSAERKKALCGNLEMFFSGFTRFSSDIQKAVLKEAPSKRNDILKEMLLLVDEAEDILTDEKRDLREFGYLLDRSWRLKRAAGNGISTDMIDSLYEKGLRAGALGGKLLGAGGGGFMVFFVEPENRPKLFRAMEGYLRIPFEFEEKGSRIIYSGDESADI